MTTSNEITKATEADVQAAADRVADAFHDIAVCEWLVPDPERRRQILPAYFRILADAAFDNGEIFFTGANREGAALWIYHGDEPVAIPDRYNERLHEACQEWTERFLILDEQFDLHHPHSPNHHHLALLAVTPSAQGNGFGAALLRQHHEWLDANGMPGYLEASSMRSRALYERHGYVFMGKTLDLPDGPHMWPMWREPQS
ncbi:MAG TPA: GNAT family N-acetyltransferase [Pseudonocardiaceae bacterium]|nr:GNAT family N-acetyltransferase [Pseudonocardiaceae bacterium]